MLKKKYVFSESDKEWHQTLLNAFEKMLKMKIRPVIVYDRKHFKQYLYGDGSNANSFWAECIKESGTIWLSPHLSTNPKVDTLNTLVHECLHIKYPNKHENQIRRLADSIVPITQSTSTKKRKFDLVHKNHRY